MTSLTRKWATLVGVLLMATALGCASTSKSEGTGEPVAEAHPAGKVKTASATGPTREWAAA